MSHRIPSTGNGFAVSTYDLLLALVPACLALGIGGAWLLPVSTTAGVVAGGTSAALVCGYGLFYRTPVARERGPGSGSNSGAGRAGPGGTNP